MLLDSLPSVWLSIILYSLCSGSLLLVNKVVLLLIPSAPLVTSIQCFACIIFIGGGSLFFDKPTISPLTQPILQAYAMYSILFVLGIYSNMRSLQVSNVDTVIVFRSAIPLFVSLGDWIWMGRELPSFRSICAMCTIVVGCICYVIVDADFSIASYGWVSVYLVCIAAEMLFGKALTAAHTVSLGTSVLLTNTFALLPFLAIGVSTGELQRGLDSRHYTVNACFILALSCALSAGIGFSGWWCRSVTSATTFTVVGTVNKFLTVLINILIWSKHASFLGTCFLIICLSGGALYQQSPLRNEIIKSIPISNTLQQPQKQQRVVRRELEVDSGAES